MSSLSICFNMVALVGGTCLYVACFNSVVQPSVFCWSQWATLIWAWKISMDKMLQLWMETEPATSVWQGDWGAPDPSNMNWTINSEDDWDVSSSLWLFLVSNRMKIKNGSFPNAKHMLKLRPFHKLTVNLNTAGWSLRLASTPRTIGTQNCWRFQINNHNNDMT